MQKNYKRIARLITKEMVGGLSSEERKDLLTWLDENKNNRHLLKEVKKSGNFKAWLHSREADRNPAWEYIYTTIQKKERQLIISRIIQVAASILLPLLIAGGIYFFIFRQISEQVNTQQLVGISPGGSKAVLMLDDGRKVVLDTPEEKKIKEKNGTLIYKSGKSLDYTGQEKEGKINRPLFNTIRVPRGGEYNLVLSDSTRVFLNAMSEFRYPIQFAGEIREVELKGEAYFDVSHSGSPFIVKTGKVDVEVMGTSFNVNAYEDTERVITTLVDGSVKVAIAGKSEEGRFLIPEEQAVCNINKGNIEVEKVDVSLFTSWKDGEFIFYDMRLEDIMTILCRWYSANVFYLDPSVKDLRFNGNLDRYGNITQILDIIKATNKVKVEVNGKAILFW